MEAFLLMKKNPWLTLYKLPLFVIFLITFVDQITKFYIAENVLYQKEVIPVISGFFDIVHVHNTGAAWGMFGDKTWLLAIVSIVAAILFCFFFKKMAEGRALQAFSLSLIIGGTVGNMIDRCSLGYVIDFLSVHWPWGDGTYYFPAFNVADSAICVGVFIYAVCSFIYDRKEKKEKEVAN